MKFKKANATANRARQVKRLLPLVFIWAFYACPAAELLLADFRNEGDISKVKATDAKVERLQNRNGLGIATGHEQPWPGIILPGPVNGWDLTPYAQVAVEVKNSGTNAISVVCRVDNSGANGSSNCLSRALSLTAGQTGRLQV